MGDDAKQIKSSKCSDDLYFNADFLLTAKEIELSNELNRQNQDSIDKFDTSGFLQLQLIHLQNLLQQISNLRNELNEGKQTENDIYGDLLKHRLSSSSYSTHLKAIEKMYRDELNDIGSRKVKKEDLENQLRIIQQQLQIDQNFSKQYGETLRKFQNDDINDPLKRQKELIVQIQKSRQQIMRLKSTMRQHQTMLRTLKRQIDATQET